MLHRPKNETDMKTRWSSKKVLNDAKYNIKGTVKHDISLAKICSRLGHSNAE